MSEAELIEIEQMARRAIVKTERICAVLLAATDEDSPLARPIARLANQTIGVPLDGWEWEDETDGIVSALEQIEALTDRLRRQNGRAPVIELVRERLQAAGIRV